MLNSTVLASLDDGEINLLCFACIHMNMYIQGHYFCYESCKYNVQLHIKIPKENEFFQI